MCNGVILGDITDREFLLYNFLSDELFFVLLRGFCFLTSFCQLLLFGVYIMTCLLNKMKPRHNSMSLWRYPG